MIDLSSLSLKKTRSLNPEGAKRNGPESAGNLKGVLLRYFGLLCVLAFLLCDLCVEDGWFSPDIS
jgi:hypothetical protein